MNPYAVLGVDPSDDAETIRLAYRRYVVTHHPDRGGDPAVFQRGIEAFRLLQAQPARVPGTLSTHRHLNLVARIIHRRTHRPGRRVI
jgi:hypothetical protein